MTQPIPVTDAELIAKARGYDQVIIVARKVGSLGGEWLTTYGVDPENSQAAAHIGLYFKHRLMGWPVQFGTEVATEPQERVNSAAPTLERP